MKMKIGRNEKLEDVPNIKIMIGDVEFKVSENQFNELVITKTQLGEGEGAIIIKPSVSNEIRLT